MKPEIDDARAERMTNAKIGMIEAFQDCKLTIPEGMTVLTSLMVQLYDDLYPNDTKADYLETMEQVYDAYMQIKQLLDSGTQTLQ